MADLVNHSASGASQDLVAIGELVMCIADYLGVGHATDPQEAWDALRSQLIDWYPTASTSQEVVISQEVPR